MDFEVGKRDWTGPPLLVLAFFVGKQRQQHFEPIFVSRRIKISFS
jgi:hypothetical protein